MIIDKTFKLSEQCCTAVKKANEIVGIIKRKVQNKTKDIMAKLYKTLVRSHVEYCIQF